MSEERIESPMSDDDIMRFTQGTRKRLIDQMIKNGVPDGKEEVETLLHAMADMDRTALGNKRIGANERQAAADALVARAISQLGSQFGSTNPFEGNTSGVIPTIDQAKLPSANPVPGETEVGISEMNYDALIEKFE